jgi:hypothetical protein
MAQKLAKENTQRYAGMFGWGIYDFLGGIFTKQFRAIKSFFGFLPTVDSFYAPMLPFHQLLRRKGAREQL